MGSLNILDPSSESTLSAPAATGLIDFDANLQLERELALKLVRAGMLSSVYLAQFTTMLGRRLRRELNAQVAQLRASEVRLQAEAAERERTAHKLAESEATLRRIFDATPDAIMIARHSDSAYFEVNQAAAEFGYSRAELLSSNAISLGM